MHLPPALQAPVPMQGSLGGRGRRFRGTFIAAIAWVGVVVWAGLLATLFLYVNPAVDKPERSDAVVVLAPPISTGRIDFAERLMAHGYSATLVISVTDEGHGIIPTDLCNANRPYRVICFSPDPVTTQGEARAIQRLSDEHDWESVTVVTNDFHITRARIVIERCYSQELNMLAVRQDRSLLSWAYRIAYETAAFVKVAGDSGC